MHTQKEGTEAGWVQYQHLREMLAEAGLRIQPIAAQPQREAQQVVVMQATSRQPRNPIDVVTVAHAWGGSPVPGEDSR